MRNLLGRLNARSVEELARIASFWEVAANANDRSGLVARLYRELNDPRTVRDAWARLDPDERQLVRLLATAERTPNLSLTIADLAAQLGRPVDEVRATAVELYGHGILAREGDAGPLPVGELPRLFLPRELATQFGRVQDEIEAGDLSTTPLRALLALLEDREIEASAERWGLRVIPGFRSRDDLTAQIVRQAGDPARIDDLVASLPRDARAAWDAVRAVPAGEIATLPRVMDALQVDGSDHRASERFRDALANLEEALLVWHTYLPGEERALFIPREIRQPGPYLVAGPELPPPVEIDEAALPDDPNPDAVAWDLLALLRAYSGGAVPAVRRPADLPAAVRKRLAQAFWNADGDRLPDGYLDFLTALGHDEGLLVGGGTRSDDPISATPAVRLWRTRTFAQQVERLHWWWLNSPLPVETGGRDEVDVRGASWAPFRRRLLAHLAGLDGDDWRRIEDVAQWLAARDPDMLGTTATIATARAVPGGDDASRRLAALALVIEGILLTAARWFGLVAVVRAPSGGLALRLTPAGRTVAAGKPWEADPVDLLPGPPLRVSPGGELTLFDPTPLRVWSLSAFADLVEREPLALWRIDEASVARALASGFEPAQVVTFLTDQAGTALPSDVTALVESSSRKVRRVRVGPAIVLHADDPATSAQLLLDLAAADWIGTQVGDVVVAQPPEGVTAADAPQGMAALLREAGYTVVAGLVRLGNGG